MDSLHVLSIGSRWIHLLSVIVAIGGSFLVRFALMPAARAVLSDADHDRLRTELMRRWAKVVHTCLGLLVMTGAVNLYVVLRVGVEPMPYHAIFGVKMILVLVVFFFAVALTGSSPGFASLRASAGKWLAVQVVVAACVVLLSGVLKSLHS